MRELRARAAAVRCSIDRAEGRSQRTQRMKGPARMSLASSLDLDALDLVADLDPLNDGHVRGVQKTEVRVDPVEMMRVDLDDEELRVVHLRRIGRARDADGTRNERQAVVLARDLVPARSRAGRVASLDDPVFDAVKREALVEAAPRLLREPRDRLRRLVRPQGEGERPALRELD